MRLLAIGDLHLGHAPNRDALAAMGRHPDDWLILAGDVGESPSHLEFALAELTPRFRHLVWVPGNHDLWVARAAPDTSTPASEPTRASPRERSEAATRRAGERVGGPTGETPPGSRYDELVAICRRYGALTPEDPYAEYPARPGLFIVPMFLLYDYSFRPPGVPLERAVGWARESGVVCGDEHLLDPSPWPSRIAWCHARVAATEARLAELPGGASTVLINHWPLRYDLARPPRIPRFSLWSGTSKTEDWGRRYAARVVVSGHLHLRTTLWRDGVRYDEVSLGYPRDWRADLGVDWYLREILPGTSAEALRFIPTRDPFV